MYRAFHQPLESFDRKIGRALEKSKAEQYSIQIWRKTHERYASCERAEEASNPTTRNKKNVENRYLTQKNNIEMICQHTMTKADRHIPLAISCIL